MQDLSKRAAKQNTGGSKRITLSDYEVDDEVASGPALTQSGGVWAGGEQQIAQGLSFSSVWLELISQIGHICIIAFIVRSLLR